MGDARGLLQDGFKGLAVDRVAPKRAVHQRAGVVERAQGARGQAFDTHGGLVEQKGFQNGMRLLLVQVVAGHVQHAGFVIKARIDGAQAVRGGVEPLLDVHQQNLVELGDRLGRPVVALHQRLAGAGQRTAFAADVGIAKGLGHGGLQVKDQPVFAALGGHVQAHAD